MNHRRRLPIAAPRPQLTPPRARRDLATRPLWAVLILAMLLGTVLVGRLGQLQIVQHTELAERAAQVSTRTLHTPALRGRILADDGTPLTANAPSSVLTIEPEILLESEDEGRALIARLAAAVDLPVEELWGRTRLCGTEDAPPVPLCFSGSPYQPVPLAHDVDTPAALAVLERPEDFPGIDVQTHPRRDYPAPQGVNAAHLLGYLGPASAAEVDDPQRGIHAEDRVGRAGLEAVYDELLRGQAGSSTVTVDPRGVVTGLVDSTDPLAGADLVTHVDVSVQAATEQALEEAVQRARAEGAPTPSAAAVVLRVTDGAVIAAASWPSYDPGVWTTGVSQAQYVELTDPEQGQPLLNRLVAQTFPPASTFKVVSLAAALQTGIDSQGSYACPGSVVISGQRFTNYESEAYGQLDLQRIMEVSCDTSFYTWAHDHWLSLGGLAQTSDEADRFIAVARGFGLGEPTGIDLPNEASGLIPSRAWKREYWEATREETCERAETGYPEVEDRERREFLEQLAQENCVDGWQWRPGDAVNFSIGQGEVSTTPLQMAVVYAAIANGGDLWTPRLADRFVDAAGAVVHQVQPQVRGRVALTQEAWETIRSGLEGVNVAGTAAGVFAGWPHEDYPLAGKTGSAESFGNWPTSWYASYGPVHDPEYAVVVMAEQAGLGAQVATPAARAIWQALRETG